MPQSYQNDANIGATYNNKLCKQTAAKHVSKIIKQRKCKLCKSNVKTSVFMGSPIGCRTMKINRQIHVKSMLEKVLQKIWKIMPTWSQHNPPTAEQGPTPAPPTMTDPPTAEHAPTLAPTPAPSTQALTPAPTTQAPTPQAPTPAPTTQAKMAESTAVDVVPPENVIGLLAEKAKDYFAKRGDEANCTFDCAEMVKCNRIATEVSVDPTKAQTMSTDERDAFVEGCKSEEATVRADIANDALGDNLKYKH
jgi:hypothetical protein